MLATPALLGGFAAADDLVVPRDFADIQQAITRASVGDRVIVQPGTYDDNLRMRSGVDVLGVETARVILRARNPANATVTFDTVTGGTLSGFTLDGGTVGVQVIASNGVTIANNVVESTAGTGVLVDVFSTALVRNVTFVNNAIAIERGTALPVIGNIFFGNGRTIVSAGGASDGRANVSFNCYFRNTDLEPAFGAGAQLGDPLFVNPDVRDFHLQQGSSCIDIGGGTDAVDASVADAGAYGGATADLNPFPVSKPTATAAGATAIDVSWPPNLDYHVTSSVVPGGYRLFYALNDSEPPLEGTDAGGGTQHSPIDAGNVTAFTLANLSPAVAAPAAPQLLSAEPRQNGAVLAWSAVPGATAYRVSYGIGSVDENRLDVGAVTTVTLGGLVDGTLYRFAVTASAQAQYSIAVTALDNTQSRHESALSAIATVPLGNAVGGARSNELTAIPGPTIPVPDLPDEGGCFIATSAFDGADRAEVKILRDFRDRYLLPTRAGRAFVAAYYRASPAWSRKLDAHPAWKPWVRGALAPAVGGALVAVGSNAAQKVALLALLVALAIVRLQRRRRERLREAAP
ncbi:MAG TPA: CFI-box-CTERM domain-containing protein [Gammaproteobacteria bacterium]|nr:CFI-box-CTERM domain-containing protein [Gammaproteobacteria bacterium]